MTKSVADQIRELQNKLSALQEEKAKPGLGGTIGDLIGSFTKAARAAKELGPIVRVEGEKGLEIYTQIEGTKVYQLTRVNNVEVTDGVKMQAVDLLDLAKKNPVTLYGPRVDKAEPSLDNKKPLDNDPVGSAKPGGDKADAKTEPDWDHIEKMYQAIKARERAVEVFAKNGKVYFSPEIMSWAIKNKATVRQTIEKFYPEAIPKFKADRGLELKFWQTAEKEGKDGKVINIKKILIALGIIAILMYNKDKVIPKKDNVDDGGAGAKVASTDGSNATTIPADEISWTALGYRRLEGQSISKNSKGEWVTPSGAKAEDPEIIKKLEELAAMSSEKRKDLKSRQDAPFQVFLYDPGSDSSPSADIPTNTHSGPTATWGSR